MHCPAIPVQGIGRLLIRLPFRISPGPDVSESPRRSIVLGPFLGVALSQPFPPPPSSFPIIPPQPRFSFSSISLSVLEILSSRGNANSLGREAAAEGVVVGWRIEGGEQESAERSLSRWGF